MTSDFIAKFGVIFRSLSADVNVPTCFFPFVILCTFDTLFYKHCKYEGIYISLECD